MTTKYCVHPGFIVSKTDGDIHYVGYQQLVMLYKVPAEECITFVIGLNELYDSLIHLYTRSDGTYTFGPNDIGNYTRG